ncbi:MAG: hypothetical protein QOD94_637 [Alphaproteobacteria bacterium]|nr:hypothetical protein [Alphaproteobacteria bacterium]
MVGSFDRPLALNIGALAPAIPQAGENLDTLVGPWIEGVGKNRYRVSPLAALSGRESLTEHEQRAIHAAIALQMLQRRTIDASDANMVFGHALAGKSEPALFAMSHNIMTTKHETLVPFDRAFLCPAIPKNGPTDIPGKSDPLTDVAAGPVSARRCER